MSIPDMRPPPLHHARSSAAAPNGRPPLPDLHGCRVLLAEDNPVNQRLLVRLLEHVGAQVSVVDNGQLAVQQVAEQSHDLVLMDVQMPVLDGLAATQAIRQLGPHGQLPIIAISASARPEDRQRCLAAGMHEFLAKPVRVEQLYACLSQYLGRATPPPAGAPASAGQSALPAIAGLDSGLGLQHSGGDAALYLSLLQRFLASTRDSLPRLRRALQRDERLDAQRLVHTLKGLAGSLGATTLMDAAAALEQAIVAGASPSRREPLLDALQGRLLPLLAGLEAFFAGAAPGTPAAATASAAPADAAAIIPHLARLLDGGDAEALDCLAEHAASLRTALAGDYAEFARRLNDFDFAGALSLLPRHPAAAPAAPHLPGIA